MATVHRITMIVVDHDDLSEAELIEEINSALSLSVVVTAHESKEIEWDSDDNPFNYDSKIPAAAEKLFGKEPT